MRRCPPVELLTLVALLVMPLLARAASDTDLAGIIVFPGSLYPSFAPDIDVYEVRLPLGAPAFSLSIAPRSPDARVYIDGLAAQLTTVPRDTTTRVEVTAESGESALVTLRSRPPQQTAYVKATNPDVGDGFGSAVALAADGATLAVGAPGEDGVSLGVAGEQLSDGRPDSGAVYVYRRAGEAWRFDAYIKSRLPTHAFGAAVALSPDGKLLAVGEPDEDSGAIGSGAVELYERLPHGWRHRALVKAPERSAAAAFGASVALSRDVLVVGAPGEGAAYVLTRGGGFRHGERLVPAPTSERFGETVSVGADGVVVAVAGMVTTRIYSATRAGMREVLTIPGGHGVVSGDGTVAAAVEPASDCVHVYASGGHGWFSSAQFAASGERLALDGTGHALVIGNVVDRFANRGSARIFRWDGQRWVAGEALIADNAAANDLAGLAVALDGRGETVAIGAPGEDGGGTELSGDPANDAVESAGAAYLFR